MLVVTSNWCIPDGSLTRGPAAWLVDRVRMEVRRACLRAGVRTDGLYRPVPAVAIVCAGDTFDWLTSREWTGDVRPWESSRRAAIARERVAGRSLRHGGRLLGTLAAWARRGLVVPVADRRGRPLPGSVHRVGVRVSLLRGDRDRWIDGMPVPEGIAGVATGVHWTDGVVMVRHGEEIEPPWSSGGAEPTLGESLAVDLLARFGGSLADSAWSSTWAPAVVRGIVVGRLVDAPVLLAVALDDLARGGTLSAAERESVIGAWNRAVSVWHRAARRLGVGRAGGIDVVDDVAAAMTLSAAAPPVATRWNAADECREDDGHTAGWREILGHPPAGHAPAPGRHGSRLCIGPPPVPVDARDRRAGGVGLALFDPPRMIPRSDNGASVGVPSAVVVRPGPSPAGLDWLPLASGGAPPDTRQPGIWRSPSGGSDGRVVDAA